MELDELKRPHSGENLGNQEPNHENAFSKFVILLILQEFEFGAYFRIVLERNSFGWNFCILRVFAGCAFIVLTAAS